MTETKTDDNGYVIAKRVRPSDELPYVTIYFKLPTDFTEEERLYLHWLKYEGMVDYFSRRQVSEAERDRLRRIASEKVRPKPAERSGWEAFAERLNFPIMTAILALILGLLGIVSRFLR